MTPIRTDSTTTILGAPPDWDEAKHGACAGLPVTVDDGLIYSYWRPSWRERVSILFGRPVRLCVASAAMPPVSVDTHT